VSWRFVLVGFVLLLGFDTAAQLSLKSASTGALPLEFSLAWVSRLLHQRTLYGAMLGFIAALIVWMALLRRAPIGPAFAASNLDIVTVLVTSHWLLGEHIGWPQVVGTSLIVAGVACLAIAAGRDAPP
jgi:drug/metabolite transporter (DMT)-like permease